MSATDDCINLEYKHHKQFAHFFTDFALEICAMGLKHIQTDRIFQLCDNLIMESHELCLNITKKSNVNMANIENIVSSSSRYIRKKIGEVKTRHLRDKMYQTLSMYVPPQENSIGLKWRTKVNLKSDMPIHDLVNTTYHHVPVKNTLTTLFLNHNFKKMYIDYNLKYKHICEDEKYKGFCCSSTCKQYDIFQDKLAIQIQLATDEFEPCSGMKSKANLHKTLFGFTESFNSHFYCRICNFSKAKCQSTCVEQTQNTRLERIYNTQIQKLKLNPHLDHIEGDKSYCPFNDLQYFYIFTNISVDLMHDIPEGVIPFLIKMLFQYCVYHKVVKIKFNCCCQRF